MSINKLNENFSNLNSFFNSEEKLLLDSKYKKYKEYKENIKKRISVFMLSSFLVFGIHNISKDSIKFNNTYFLDQYSIEFFYEENIIMKNVESANFINSYIVMVGAWESDGYYISRDIIKYYINDKDELNDIQNLKERNEKERYLLKGNEWRLLEGENVYIVINNQKYEIDKEYVDIISYEKGMLKTNIITMIFVGIMGVYFADLVGKYEKFKKSKNEYNLLLENSRNVLNKCMELVKENERLLKEINESDLERINNSYLEQINIYKFKK